MSTEYYSTKKILWRELKERPLPDGLTWWRNPKLLSNKTYVGSLFDGENYLYVWTGDHYHLQGNDPDIAVFERFGLNEPSKILLRLGEMHDCSFVSDQGFAIVGVDEEVLDEELRLLSQAAKKR